MMYTPRAGRRGRGLGAALCLAALLFGIADASALSLGRMRGTPLIGRPLQVVIPVVFDAADNPPCVRAEMLQGETPGGPLNWRLERAPGGGNQLRLTSSAVVQEPVVTVNLTVGCREQFMRDFVLLSERPDQAQEAANAEATAAAAEAATPLALAPAASLASLVPPAPLPAAPAAAPATSAAPAVAVARAAAPTAPVPPRATSRVPQRAVAQAPAAERPAPRAAPAQPRQGGPRLKLEPIDVAIDEAPALRISTQLSTVPAATPLSRAEASAVFQTMNTAPENLAAQALKGQAIEGELKAMRELVQRQGLEMKALAERLESVSRERNLISNALAAFAVIVALGLAGLLWRRSRESAARAAWWKQEDRDSEPALPAAPAAAQALAAQERTPEPEVAAPGPQTAPAAQEAGHELDLDFTLATGAWMVAPPAATPAVSAPVPFGPYDRSRVPRAEELLDIKEKAEFFLAVAQPDKAIALLELHLHDHLGISPFVWMDVLDLCRRHDRRADYERLRAEFHKLFPMRLPDFDSASPDSQGLEDHPRALSRIMLLWPSERVLQVIEESLFEEPQPGAIMFDLEASRDLLLLYSIATEVVRGSGEGAEMPRTIHAPMHDFVLPDDDEPTSTETQPVPLAALDFGRPAKRAPAAPSDSSLQSLETASALAPLDFSLAPFDPPATAKSETAAAPAAPATPDIDLSTAGTPLLEEYNFDFEPYRAKRPDR